MLRLMAERLDDAVIARRLGLSVKTVQNHVSRLLTKLDARTRVEVVLRFRGTADPAEPVSRPRPSAPASTGR